MLPNSQVRGRGVVETPLPEFPLDNAVSANFAEAMRGLIDHKFLASQNWQEQHWRADREGVHPDILEFERRFIAKMKKLGIPMFANELFRDGQRQNELWLDGKSRAQSGNSAHNWGCAIDLVHSTKGWQLDRKQWLLVGHVGQEIVKQAGLAIVSLAWGGQWKFYDPAHWEIADWKMVKGQYPWTPKK